MAKLTLKGSTHVLNRIRGFLFGLFFGVVLSTAGTALSADDAGDRGFAKSILYAIAMLAIDTEKNAAYILELRQRMDDLEELLDEKSTSEN